VISINTIDEMERNTLRIQLSLRIISPEEIITTVEFIVERLR
jgi:hypothetical protein